MSRELGTTDRAWSQWENGKRLLDVLVAVRLKERYGVTLDWLFDGDPARPPLGLAERVRRGRSPNEVLRRDNRRRPLTGIDALWQRRRSAGGADDGVENGA